MTYITKTLGIRRVGTVFAITLATVMSGCAVDVAQGYRSTPDYPAYAYASDGQYDELECAVGVGTTIAADQFRRDMERQSGYSIPSVAPDSGDLLGGLAMAFVFALAEDRPAMPVDAL